MDKVVIIRKSISIVGYAWECKTMSKGDRVGPTEYHVCCSHQTDEKYLNNITTFYWIS